MNRIKFTLNILLAVVMLLLMDPRSFYGLEFHEWAGLFIGLFFLLHKALNWGWIKKVTVCFFRSSPGRARLNYVLDVLLLAGIYAFNRLSYWEESVRIFRVDNEQSYNRAGGRHREDFGRGERSDFFEREFRQNSRELHNENSGPVNSDTLNKVENTRTARRTFNGRDFDRSRHHQGGLGRRSNVRLENVGLFLAVFALFTVVTIFIEKMLKKIRTI